MGVVSKKLNLLFIPAALLMGAPARASVNDVAFAIGSEDNHLRFAYRVPGPVVAFAYRSELAVDYDGAPIAYHPSNRRHSARNPRGKALDWTSNAGRRGKWWGLASADGRRPYVQKRRIDPKPGFYVSTTSLVDVRVARETDPRRYVDATLVPYVVLPPKAQRSADNPEGAQLGDFAAVVNMRNRKVVYAVFADSGPHEKLGEGSAALAEALQNPDDQYDVVTVVFPGSHKDPSWPQSVAQINAEGERLFERFGGLARVDELFNDPLLN